VSDPDDLIEGFRRFRRQYFEKEPALYRDLVAHGQKPRVAMVACADSRVDPSVVLQAEPGTIFAIRNVANLVPPHDPVGGYHGTSAALEFAVRGLGVAHVIVLGHAHCGGIRALLDRTDNKEDPDGFIGPWMQIAEAAARRVIATMPDAEAAVRQRTCEQNAVLVSLENLTTFPWIREGINDGRLRVHGWYVDIAEGRLSVYDPAAQGFVGVA
jgi:carbonic anhydrase